jgi:hypothetical protein
LNNIPDVKRNDSNGIACHHVDVLAFVVEDERVHPVDKNVGEEVRAVLLVQVEQDLAVGIRGELRFDMGTDLFEL